MGQNNRQLYWLFEFIIKSITEKKNPKMTDGVFWPRVIKLQYDGAASEKFICLGLNGDSCKDLNAVLQDVQTADYLNICGRVEGNQLHVVLSI